MLPPVPLTSIRRGQWVRWTGLAAACVLASCGRPEGVAEQRTRTFSAGPLLLLEVGEADLVALEAASGKALFRYQYSGTPIVPFARSRAPLLVCPPRALADRLVLRYEESVHVLSIPSGELLWQRECLPTACPRLCSAVLPGGAVAVVTGSGRTLTLVDPSGTEAWTKPLPGAAVAAPEEAAGRLLVRTRDGLLALDEEGAVTWQGPIGDLAVAPLPPGTGPVPRSR